MNEKTKEFLEFYRQLCEEYGLLIEVGYSEGSTDGYLGVETILNPNELEDHIKELEEGS